jgi:periplasmic divalent cation tolerance protein
MEPAERSVPEPVHVAPPDGLLLVLSNVPDQEVAAAIARALVDERLAACVNILGACRSIYRWRGEVEEADEVTLLVKTTRRRHAACLQRLEALHPYEVPEIVTIVPDAVWPAYASWAIAETRVASSRRDQD